MQGFEWMGLIAGALMGFCWIWLYILIWTWPEGRVAMASRTTKPQAEPIATFCLSLVCFLLLCALWPKIWGVGLDSLTDDQKFARSFILPMLIGPSLWFPFLVIFGGTSIPIPPDQRLPGSPQTATSDERTEAPPLSEAMATNPGPPRRYKIDGNNIAMLGRTDFDVDIVAALARFLTAEGAEVHVFFDANVGMMITAGKTHLAAADLARRLSLSEDQVTIVPGGSRADDWVLLSADEDSGVIVSNDRFRDYVDRFPFLLDDARHLTVAREGARYRIAGFSRSFVVARSDAHA